MLERSFMSAFIIKCTVIYLPLCMRAKQCLRGRNEGGFRTAERETGDYKPERSSVCLV